MKSSIYEEYSAIARKHAAANARQFDTPNGFYKAFDAKGKACGMGFFCETCKFSIPYNAPDCVSHCRTVTTQPRGWFAWFKRLVLPSYQIRARHNA